MPLLLPGFRLILYHGQLEMQIQMQKNCMSLVLLKAEILPFLYFGWLPWKQLKGKQ